MTEHIDAAGTATDSDSDRVSVDTVVQRCLPVVQRWAHGRLPPVARGQFDTCDLVQEAALRMLRRGGRFAPQHPEAVQAYLRLTVLNLIRDELRRMGRRPKHVELEREPVSDRTGPLQLTIRQEVRAQCEEAMRQLKPRDRQLVEARMEEEGSFNDVARALGLRSPAAARMAIKRAVDRLVQKMGRRGESASSTNTTLEARNAREKPPERAPGGGAA